MSTRWSMVLQAGEVGNPEECSRALEYPCRSYWYPLFAYLRRSGESPENAQDLPQGFFAHLLSRGALSIEPGQGRYRSFLIRSLKNDRTSEWRRNRAQKRGGDVTTFSLDADNAEERYRFEPADDGLSPEACYDRQWARSVVARGFVRLREECRRTGREDRFDALRPFMLANPGEPTAERLGLSSSGLRTQLQRMRARFGHLLRREIAETVSRRDEVEEEARYFLESLG